MCSSYHLQLVQRGLRRRRGVLQQVVLAGPRRHQPQVSPQLLGRNLRLRLPLSRRPHLRQVLQLLLALLEDVHENRGLLREGSRVSPRGRICLRQVPLPCRCTHFPSCLRGDYLLGGFGCDVFCERANVV